MITGNSNVLYDFITDIFASVSGRWRMRGRAELPMKLTAKYLSDVYDRKPGWHSMRSESSHAVQNTPLP